MVGTPEGGPNSRWILDLFGGLGGAQEHHAPRSCSQDLPRTSPDASAHTLIGLAQVRGRQLPPNHAHPPGAAPSPPGSWLRQLRKSSATVTPDSA